MKSADPPRSFLPAAKRIVLDTIAYLYRVQICPFCAYGTIESLAAARGITVDEYLRSNLEVEEMPQHEARCSLQGFEMTEDVERLKAWAESSDE